MLFFFVASTQCAKHSLLSFYFAFCTELAVFFSKWCTILNNIAALFVFRGDLDDFDAVGALLSTATSPSLPAVENRFSRSW